MSAPPSGSPRASRPWSSCVAATRRCTWRFRSAPPESGRVDSRGGGPPGPPFSVSNVPRLRPRDVRPRATMAHRFKTTARRVVTALAVSTLVVGAAYVGHHRAEVRPELATRERLASTVPEAPKAPEADSAAPARTPEPGWDIPNLDHSRVDYWIGRFQTD